MRIGVSGVAHPHVEYVLDEVRREGGPVLVGVADPDPAAAARCAAEFEVPTFRDTSALLAAAAPDVLYAAGVYSERADAIVAGLTAGCHVISDKPMCTTEDDLDRIARAAAAGPGQLSLLLEKRAYPETRALRQLVADGALGSVVGLSAVGPHKLTPSTRPAWFFDRGRYGGLLNDLAVHDLDLALLLMGPDPVEVSGQIVRSGPGREPFSRFGRATLSSASALAGVDVDWLTPTGSAVHGDYQLRVTGTAGVAEVYWSRHELIVTTAEPRRSVALPAPCRPAEPVLASLARGERPEVDAVASIRATRAALLAQRSAETGGRPLPLPHDSSRDESGGSFQDGPTPPRTGAH